MIENITLFVLQQFFPEDTVWAFSRSEITGYSIAKGLHFTIDDGVCRSPEGEYMLTIYKQNPKTPNWMPNENRGYPIKYFGLEYILFQDWVDFLSGDWSDCLNCITE